MRAMNARWGATVASVSRRKLIAYERAVARPIARRHGGRWVGPLLLPFAGGLSSLVSWRVRVRPVIADDGLHRAYGERGAILAADGERDGAQNHAILRGTNTTKAYALSRVVPQRAYGLAHVIAGVHDAAVLSKKLER